MSKALSQPPATPSAKADDSPSRLPRPPRPLGGVFSPVAQYPGTSYDKVLSTSKDAPYTPSPKENQSMTAAKTVVRAVPNAQVITPHAYENALLLVEVESSARMDKKALRDAGISRVQVLTSGMLAARFLAMQLDKPVEDTEAVDCIFCYPRLEDMSAMQWMDLLRQHPRLAALPMVVITGNVEEAHILRTMTGGFDAVLMRPYTQDDVRRLLGNVYENFQPKAIENSQEAAQGKAEFHAILKQLESYQGEGAKAEMNFREGLQHVKDKAWNAAIQALTKALYHKDVKGEAEYGLAAAWQGKKNFQKQMYYLNEACTTFVRTQKWARARLAYTQLLRALPTAENPFVRLAESHIRAQAYREAAGVLVLGLNLGNAEDAVTRVARACLFSDNPPFTLGQIQKAFTAEELQDLVQALPAEIQRLSDAHEQNMQQHREEYASLREQAKAMPLHDSVLALQQKASTALWGAQGEADATGAFATALVAPYDASSYTGHTGDMTGVIPGMPKLINAERSTEGMDKKQVLDPMGEEDLGVELFSAFPRLNDMATVVKVTWKLMHGKK